MKDLKQVACESRVYLIPLNIDGWAATQYPIIQTMPLAHAKQHLFIWHAAAFSSAAYRGHLRPACTVLTRKRQKR